MYQKKIVAARLMNIQTKELIFSEDSFCSLFYLQGRGHIFHQNIGTNPANCTIQMFEDISLILKTVNKPLSDLGFSSGRRRIISNISNTIHGCVHHKVHNLGCSLFLNK
jgi:hypothetical protein